MTTIENIIISGLILAVFIVFNYYFYKSRKLEMERMERIIGIMRGDFFPPVSKKHVHGQPVHNNREELN